MVLPTSGTISISDINSCARFTNGNMGINTTSPNYNLDINGTLKATTITAGNILATTSISSGGINATNSTVTNLYSLNSTLSNLHSTLSSIGTLRTDLGVMTEGLMTKASIQTSLTVPNLLASTSISSGAVYATNSTVTNFVATSMTAGPIFASNNVNASQSIIVQNTNSGSSAYSILTLATDQSNFNIFKNSSTRTADGGANVTTLRNDGGPLRLQSNIGMGICVGSSGNVGINTTTPNVLLHVHDEVSSIIKVSGAVAGQQGFNISDTASRWSIYKPGNTTDLRFYDGGADRVTFANGGNVTINGWGGSYPLTVFGSSNSGSIGGYAGWSGNYGWQNQTTSYDVSIYSQYFMMAGQGFVSVSDQRIKKDIIEIEDGESLNILRQIEPKRYRYIDEYKRGTHYVYGFIAQQVRGVLPAASGLVKDFIPSIMTSATVSYDSTNDITTVTLVDNKQHNLTSENSNSRVRFFDENDQNTDLELHEIVSGDIFKVKGELKGVNTFAYGVEVDDFHTLNKDAIFTVALSALQQVDKELQETKQTVNDLLQRIQALENAN